LAGERGDAKTLHAGCPLLLGQKWGKNDDTSFSVLYNNNNNNNNKAVVFYIGDSDKVD